MVQLGRFALEGSQVIKRAKVIYPDAQWRPFTHTKSVVRGRARPRESHFRLSLTVSPRLFLLKVANSPVLHRLAAVLLE